MKTRPSDNAIFACLPPGVQAALSGDVELVEFRQGDLFHTPGALIEKVHFPVDGVVSVVTDLTDGGSVETASIGREGAVGLSSALTPIRAHGRVIGQAPGSAYVASSETMRRLAAESPPLREIIVRHGEIMLAQAQQSTACNIAHDVEERFCRWILSCDDRVRGPRVELTQEFLAMMLGVQRTTVSHVASTLQSAGLIRYNRGRIDILDRAGLERRSCECYEVVRRRSREFLPASADAATPTRPDEQPGLG